MNIVVLNGSPKGEKGITLHYARYMEKISPAHTWKEFHIAQRISKLEQDADAFSEVVQAVEKADAVLWAFPLYVYMVHAGLKRFIELITENHVQSAFAGKYTAALSTSIHFFDHTAHRYLHAVCEDLGMRYIGFHSPDMNDLLTDKGQKEITRFTHDYLEAVETRRPVSRAFDAMPAPLKPLAPLDSPRKADLKGKQVVLLADGVDPETNLGKMVSHLLQAGAGLVQCVDLQKLDMKGHCLGCLKCGSANHCVYDDRDAVRQTYEHLKSADVLVFAGTIRDRFLSARWKQFYDRRFYNTHQRIFSGKQMAWVISGALRSVPNLRDILEAHAELECAHLAAFITDEETEAGMLAAQLDQLLPMLVANAERAHVPPTTFLGVGGMKIFRDDVWGRLRMVFPMDHRAYRKTGVYDFPQNKLGLRLSNLVVPNLLRIPAIRKGMDAGMTTYMVEPYRRLLEKMQGHSENRLPQPSEASLNSPPAASSTPQEYRR